MYECTGQSLSAHTHTWARGETRFKCEHSLYVRAEYIRERASGFVREQRKSAGRFALAHYINLLPWHYKNALSTFGSKITPYNFSVVMSESQTNHFWGVKSFQLIIWASFRNWSERFVHESDWISNWFINPRTAIFQTSVNTVTQKNKVLTGRPNMLY